MFVEAFSFCHHRFCDTCERYVSPLNKHCAKCNICPSKVLTCCMFSSGNCCTWSKVLLCVFRMAVSGSTAQPVTNVLSLVGIWGSEVLCETCSSWVIKTLCPPLAWKHCSFCSRCALPDHPCGAGPQREGCFSCGSLQHKRRACPLKDGRGLSRWAPRTCPYWLTCMSCHGLLFLSLLGLKSNAGVSRFLLVRRPIGHRQWLSGPREDRLRLNEAVLLLHSLLLTVVWIKRKLRRVCFSAWLKVTSLNGILQ